MRPLYTSMAYSVNGGFSHPDQGHSQPRSVGRRMEAVFRRTPRHRRRFGATGGDHIGTVVEDACGRSHCDDLGDDHSGDMAFHAQLGDVGQPCHNVTTRLLPDSAHQETRTADG